MFSSNSYISKSVGESFVGNKRMLSEHSCFNSLISIIHGMDLSFDEVCEIKGVLLHTLKVFDRVHYSEL